jgi:hypothetical protein
MYMLYIMLISFIMYECILMLISGVHFGEHSGASVDRPVSNGGQLMCHEVFIYVEDIIGSTWVSDTPASNFCKRDYRTPAWVNIVISLHGS